jgi:hypothetical protein
MEWISEYYRGVKSSLQFDKAVQFAEEMSYLITSRETRR